MVATRQLTETDKEMTDMTVAVAGVTGAVGVEMLRVLEARDFPVRRLVPLASARSAGRRVPFRGEEIPVEVLSESSFEGVDLALFSAGGSISKEMAPVAVKSGALVVDNSSAFRMDPDVPLVVPEVNAPAAKSHKGIIANPNCSTIIMVMGIHPIHQLSPMERIVVSTYQAASGAGAKGMDALRRELKGEEPEGSVFPHRLAGNLIPRIDTMQDDGYTREEMKMVRETIKIMDLPEIPISATCVRVPVERAHSEAIQVTTRDPVSLADVRRALEEAPGVRVVDVPENDEYPTPMAAAGQDDVYVGRIRQPRGQDRTIDLWVVGDQLLKGAALNAVQIAEVLFTGR